VNRPASQSDLENCLVSIFEGGESVDAEGELKRRGIGVLKLSAPDLIVPLDGLHQMADESGGGFRILDGIYQVLREGNLGLIVEVAPEQSGEMSDLLYKIGAKSVWEFVDWTFVKMGPRFTRRAR
jgi:hypothetical protein